MNRNFSVNQRSSNDFYNLLNLDDTRNELRQSFEKFALEECRPHAETMDKTDIFP